MSAPPRFRLARKRLAPKWLTTEEGELVGYSLDLVADASAERMRLGTMATIPQNDPSGVTTAPADALALMGRDRRVTKGFEEAEESYARRLIKWLDDRKTAGNPWALMQKLAEYTGAGPSFRTVDTKGNWFSRDANGVRSVLLKQANWEWDDHPTTNGGALRFSRFWVIVYPNGWIAELPFNWGDPDAPNWGETDFTWGTTATSDQVQTMRFIVRDWMPGGTKCINIIVAFDPDSFDPLAAVDDPGMPNGLWENWGRNENGVYVPARLSTARYWDGVIQ